MLYLVGDTRSEREGELYRIEIEIAVESSERTAPLESRVENESK